jgi:flagellar L-ring protein precursor FlgH
MTRLTITTILKRTTALATSLAAMMLLSACGIPENLAAIGKTPEMSKIQNPLTQPGYKPVTMPMPNQEARTNAPNSLWEAKRQTFFKDQRAAKVGDIVTVTIAIADNASLDNETSRAKTGTDTVGAPNVFGFESALDKVLPKAVVPATLLSTSSTATSDGKGQITRSEAINLKLAATVMQLMPNGNFVIQGRQQVLVNNEMRDLALQGIIRPEDILNDNTISYEKIAEARITYGGKGNLTNLQQPAYGQQFMEAVSPF